jgi:hypothetical protein
VAGELRVVIQLIVRIPAEYHVAESQTFIERRQELVAAQILPAQNSVAIEDSDLHMLDAGGGQRVAKVGGEFCLRLIHRI